jgi:hypothetical protein
MSDISIFRHAHPILLAVVVAAWAWVSLSLIIRMWLLHRRSHILKKLFWSFVLLVPLLGWLFYGAFFQPPSVSENPAPTEHSRDAICAPGDYPPHI